METAPSAPHQSANTSSKPPTSAEITMCGIVRRKPIIRAICGAIKTNKTQRSNSYRRGRRQGKPLTAAAQLASASALFLRLGRYHHPAVKWSASGGTAGNRQQNHHHTWCARPAHRSRCGRTGNPVSTLRHSRVTTCLQHHQKYGERGT